MSERDDRPGLRRTVEPEPAALLRSDQERDPVPHAVQDRRQRADHIRHPGRLLVPEPAWLRLRHRRAVGPRRRTDRPDRPAVGDAAEHAERRGHGVADHADDHLHAPANPCVAQGTCSVGQLVDPGMNVASLSVPLIAPNTEFGDRINQLDLNVSKTFKVRRIQHPAEDRLLQRAERRRRCTPSAR